MTANIAKRLAWFAPAWLVLFFALASSAAAQSARVPIQEQAGKLFVTVNVNGVVVDAMVDSGSQFSLLDKGFAKAVGVATEGRFSGSGFGGRVSGAWSKGVSLSLGGAAVAGSRPAVVDLAPLSRTHGRPIQAVLGREIFDRYVVDIDFEQHSLALFPREGFRPPMGTRAVSLFPAKSGMTMEVSVEGGPPLSVLIDLGSDVPLILSPGPAAHRLLDGRAASTAWLGGFGSGGAGQVATARQVFVGGETVAAVPVIVAPHGLSGDGNLGLPVLSRFRLYLDYAGGRAWLGPGPALVVPFYKDFTGFNGYVDGQVLRVLHVARGGPAARAGWRPGEVVTAINGQPAAVGNVGAAFARPGTVITFTMANGENRQLLLAEYY